MRRTVSVAISLSAIILLVITSFRNKSSDCDINVPISPNEISELKYSDEEIDSWLNEASKNVRFEENLGQWEGEVIYQAKTPQLTIRLLEDRINLAVAKKDASSGLVNMQVWEMHFPGMNSELEIRGVDRFDHYVKYADCGTEVYNYREIKYENIFPNIDLRLYGKNNGTIEYDFIVHPGGDPNDIQIEYVGIDKIDVQRDGKLIYKTSLGNISKGKPYSYQIENGDRVEIESSYKKSRLNLQYEVDKYDKSLPLIIDPTIMEWSTFLGDANAQLSGYIAKSDDCIYIGGTTAGNDFPITPGAYQNMNPGANSPFITKFDFDGNLIYSTFLGSTGSDNLFQILPHDDCVYASITLAQGGTGFPVTLGNELDADSSSILVGGIAFVKLDATGNLVWSRILDGDNTDFPGQLVTTNTALYSVDATNSTNLPTYSAIQDTLGGERDFYITKMDHAGNVLFSTYFGGGAFDLPFGNTDKTSAVASDDGVVFTGVSTSFQYPTTPGAIQTTAPPEFIKGIVTKIGPGGNLVYSTYFYGTTSTGFIPLRSIALDDNTGNVYLTGETLEGNIPSTPGSHQPIHGGVVDAHLTCISPSGALLMTTYIGGSSVERGYSVQIENDDIYVIGTTNSNLNFPTTSSSLPHQGLNDVFVRSYSTAGLLNYSVLYGSPLNDNVINGFDIDNGNAYFIANAGVVANDAYPVTPDGIQADQGSVVVKLDGDGKIEFSSYYSCGLTDNGQVIGCGDGAYNYYVEEGYDWNVTGEKADAYLNGVTAQDLSLIQRHIAGIEYLNSNYKHVAADADGNTQLDIRDVLDLRKLLLGITDELPRNKSWRTIDADYTFPGITHLQLPTDVYDYEMISHEAMQSSDLAADFIGVKVGDVDGDAIPNSFLSGETRDGSSLILKAADATFVEGDLVKIAITSDNFEAITAYQFTFGFDNSTLEYVGSKSGALNLTEGNFGTQYADRGLVTTVWYNAQAQSYQTDEVLFTMTFRARAAGSLSSAINIGSAITEAMSFNAAGSQGVEMRFTTVTGEVTGDAFALFQNTPNPFKTETQIGYILPEEGQVTMRLFDGAGKFLGAIKADAKAGYNEMTVSSKTFPSDVDHIIYYQLEANGYLATKKMVLVE